MSAVLQGSKLGNVSTYRLQVSDYEFPAVDGSAGTVLMTDGLGHLSYATGDEIVGVVGGAGSGIDERIMRWDGSENAQVSVVALNDAGDLSGATTINVGGITYPVSDGAAGDFITTNGAGTLSFATAAVGSGTDDRLARWDGSTQIQDSLVALNDAGDISGVTTINVGGITYPVSDGAAGEFITTNGAGSLSFAAAAVGSGTDNRLARWDGTTQIQDSLVALNDTGDMSGIVNLTATGNVQLASTVSYFNPANNNTAILASFDISASNLETTMVSAATNSAITDSSTSAIVAATEAFIYTDASSTVNPHRSFIGGSRNIYLSSNSGAASIASRNGLIDSSLRSAVMASFSGTIIGCRQVSILASEKATIQDTSLRSAVMASFNDTISNSRQSSLIGGIGNSITDSTYGNMMSSSTCVIDTSSTTSAIISSDTTEIHGGIREVILASAGCTMTGLISSAIIGCINVDASNVQNIISPPGMFRTVILASSDIDTSGLSPKYNIVYGGDTTRNWLIDSTTGTYYGLVNSIGAPVPDFAEYFENYVKEEMPPGALVTLEQDKIRLAEYGDEVIGIVSAQPAILAGGADMHWQGAYKHDKWGRYLTQLVPEQEWVAGPGETEADRPKRTKYVPNESYDKSKPYLSRKERPLEWTAVGLTGQVKTRVDATVIPSSFVKPSETVKGLGTYSLLRTNIRCMKITTPFSDTDGYAIALCLVK